MRILLAVLLVILLLLQYRLWVSDEGLRDVWQLQESVTGQQEENRELELRNAALEAEVRDLRQGHDAVEERARSDLGMVREDETFYRIIGEEPEPEEADDEDGL